MSPCIGRQIYAVQGNQTHDQPIYTDPIDCLFPWGPEEPAEQGLTFHVVNVGLPGDAANAFVEEASAQGLPFNLRHQLGGLTLI